MTRQKKRKRPTREERTAYHEAGHAVAAYHLRRGTKYVTIEGDDEALGRTRHTRCPSLFRSDVDQGPRTCALTERECLVNFAGPAAEARLTGRYNHKGAEHDVWCSIELASRINDSDEATEAHLKWLRVRARDMMRSSHLWSAVKALAEALLAERTIKWHRARQIIREAASRSPRGAGGVQRPTSSP